MKILVLNYEFPPLGKGGAVQCKLLIEQYLKSGHQVYLLTAGFHQYGVLHETENFTIERLNTFRKKTDRCSNIEMLTYVMRAYLRIGKILREFKADAVHIFFGMPTGLLIFHPSIRKIPSVISALGSDVPGHNKTRFQILYKIIGPILKHAWARSAALVANSGGLRDEMQAFSPKQKILVIPSGVILPEPALSNKKMDASFTILFVGRLIALKRVDLTLRALSFIPHSQRESIRFRVVGSGTELESLKALSQQLGITNEVAFLGQLNDQELMKEFSLADLYVQLSESEGMSIAVLEAISWGLPVITTNVGGAQELVAGNGVIFENPEPEIVAKKILEYRYNPGLRSDHGKISRQIATKFSISSSSDKYLELFKSLRGDV